VSQATDRAALASELSRAALMGARGNSGVILSQIVRGAAESLRDSDDLAGALRAGSDAAYRVPRPPVEGTMLTAIRELAEEAEAGGDLAAVVARGEDCVRRTQGMLPALKEAGVVDAGAAGLVEIMRGIASALAGEPLAAPPDGATWVVADEAIHHELSLYRYCTVFVVEGDHLDAAALEAELEPLGDSLFVVGDPSALKVHVHTDDPGRALSLGVARGTIAGVEIANMHEQMREREERLLHAVPAEGLEEATAAVAVASGAGNRRLLESLGARVVDGGRTMNPSTAELLAAIDGAAADGVIVLPNDRNVLMAAEHAAAAASRTVHVVPSVSLQAGLAAMVAFDAGASLDENVAAMEAAVEDIATGAVTIASRDVETNGLAVRKGAWLGLSEGVPVAGGESFDDVARAVLERMLVTPRGIVTLLTGEEPPSLDALLADLASRHPELELEVKDGGQPHYALLLAAE